MQIFIGILGAFVLAASAYMAIKGINGWGWFLFAGFSLAMAASNTTLINVKA